MRPSPLTIPLRRESSMFTAARPTVPWKARRIVVGSRRNRHEARAQDSKFKIQNSRFIQDSGLEEKTGTIFKEKAETMPINHHDIIGDMEWQIRKCGGVWSEWCVGTAKDARRPF